MTLQSAPLHCPAGSNSGSVAEMVVPTEGAVVGDSQVLVMLCKGHLHLYHSVSGIKVRIASFCVICFCFLLLAVVCYCT